MRLAIKAVLGVTLLTTAALTNLALPVRPACGEEPSEKEARAARERLIEKALTSCSRSFGSYCQELRREGPEALAALREWRDHEDIRPGRWEAVMDQVGGARYSSRSQLFWHTDLEAAKAESQRTGKPILSLRMLGRLTDEYSCANSRFFRTTLYSSPAIAERLRERFVLHWKTVRPVPVLTINFGDGRVLKRTITGNSAHYVLNARGEPLDVLPGLHAPVAFERWLKTVEQLHSQMKRSKDPQAALAAYHQSEARRIDAALQLLRRPAGASASHPAENYWTSSLVLPSEAPIKLQPAGKSTKPSRTPTDVSPNAQEATDIAQPKMAVQTPLVRSVLGRQGGKANRTPANRQAEPQQHKSKAGEATRIALTKREIQQALVRVVEGLNKANKSTAAKPTADAKPTAAKATRIAAPKRMVEGPLVRIVQGGATAGANPQPTPPLTEDEIRRFASLYPELTRLDSATLKLMREENYSAVTRWGEAKFDEATHDRATLARLTRGIAEDTVRNEWDFHRRVHRWFIQREVSDVESLDRRVYDELFLMPLDDPWLGLAPRATYSALENDGLISAPSASSSRD